MLNNTAPVWHRQSVEKILSQLDVSAEQGLAADEAGRRQQTHGPNILTKDTGKSAF